MRDLQSNSHVAHALEERAVLELSLDGVLHDGAQLRHEGRAVGGASPARTQSLSPRLYYGNLRNSLVLLES